MKENIDISQVIESLRQQLQLLRQRYQVESLSVFGSYVRHEHARIAT